MGKFFNEAILIGGANCERRENVSLLSIILDSILSFFTILGLPNILTMKIQRIQRSGTYGVRKLRHNKLSNGLPFMINSPALPSNQCYLEFPDGSFKIAALNKLNNDFEIIAELDQDKISNLRKKYKLVLAS